MRFSITNARDSGLCGRCEHSSVMRGDRLADHTILCHYFHPPLDIQRLVHECSLFQPKNTLDRYEMEKIGWVLEVKGGKVMGFKPPKKDET